MYYWYIFLSKNTRNHVLIIENFSYITDKYDERILHLLLVTLLSSLTNEFSSIDAWFSRYLYKKLISMH